MRLSSSTRLFSLSGIPMVGNVVTGAIIGLTVSGSALCHKMAERDVSEDEVPEDCLELLDHLSAGAYLEGTPLPQPRVQSAYLHVTQRCNLACRFCYSEDAGRNALEDPSLENLSRAIDLLASLGVSRLVISGGEPFLRHDLPLIAERARRSGVNELIVLTNGLLVTRESAEPLTETVDCVAVAFDGASASDPAHLRGEQRFDLLVRAVETVRSLGIGVRVLPTLHARNLSDMDRYQDLADRLGATLGFSLLTGNVCELGDLSPTDGQLREMGRRARELAGSGSDPLTERGSSLAARRSCGAGVRTLSVAADGTVYPCHMLHDQRLAMGSAFSDTPEKIMGGPVAQRLRCLDVAEIDGCAACDARYLCGGGCRARALMSAGSLTAADPYCELPRSHYEHIGERLASRFAPRGGG